jgi:peptidyl-dipeptidase Dcp
MLLAGCQSDPPDSTITVDSGTESDWLSPGQLLNKPLNQIGYAPILPALDAAVSEHRRQIRLIADNPEPASFTNTVEALDQSGSDLDRLVKLFYALSPLLEHNSWTSNRDEVAARLAGHTHFIREQDELTRRIADLRNSQPEWSPEQKRLADEIWRQLHHAGAMLDRHQRTRLDRIDEEVADLAGLYRHNLERETQRFEMHIDNSASITNLPETLVRRAASDASIRGYQDGWIFTLNAHSLYPFLQYSPDREQRRELYQAWQRRAGGLRYGQVRNNSEIARRILGLRAERARLLGYANHLELTMADSTLGQVDALKRLLHDLLEAARPVAQRELAQLRELMMADGLSEEPQAWDWWYYTRKLRHQVLGPELDQSLPWFEINQVRQGAYELATRLWGIEFVAIPDQPVWSETVSTFQILDADRSPLGLLHVDALQRPAKPGGAWVSVIRQPDGSNRPGELPEVTLVTGFSPIQEQGPVLLTSDEVETLFHEIGHALHALFSEVPYRALAGLQLPSDFIEFPALLMERWALQPEVLELYAYHYQSGEFIDAGLVDAFGRQRAFLSGLKTLEQVAAVALDLAWHNGDSDLPPDIGAMEQRIMLELDLPPILSPRHRFNGYDSLFAGTRGGRDYRLLWSEVLAADAFAVFVRAGLFDADLATRLRREILKRGNSRDPMQSWQAFRGRAPNIEHLLTERGLGTENPDDP